MTEEDDCSIPLTPPFFHIAPSLDSLSHQMASLLPLTLISLGFFSHLLFQPMKRLLTRAFLPILRFRMSSAPPPSFENRTPRMVEKSTSRLTAIRFSSTSPEMNHYSQALASFFRWTLFSPFPHPQFLSSSSLFQARRTISSFFPV